MSFNAVVGLVLHTVTLILLCLGMFFGYPFLIPVAGIISIINGILLILNTYLTKAYIGTILAPVMIISMVLLIVVGAILVYPIEIITGYNYELIALYIFIGIYFFAILHVVTGA